MLGLGILKNIVSQCLPGLQVATRLLTFETLNQMFGKELNEINEMLSVHSQIQYLNKPLICHCVFFYWNY